MVADKGFIDAFQRRFDPLECPCTTPDKIDDFNIGPPLKQVIVFLHKSEMPLVHKLRRAHPNLTIYSALYDLAPQSIEWPLTASATTPTKRSHDKPVRILVSPPASDAEFICDQMDNNGLGRPKEAFGRPLVTLLPHVQDFKVARYLENACRLNEGEEDIFLHIQTDALLAVFKSSTAQQRHIRLFLERPDVSVIRIKREDRIFQTSLSTILNRTRYRCVQQVPQDKRKDFSSRFNISPAETLAALKATTDAEDLLDKTLKGLPNVLDILFEDFVSNPIAELGTIADFLGKQLPSEPHAENIEDIYAAMPALRTSIHRQLRDVLDRIGLHASRL